MKTNKKFNYLIVMFICIATLIMAIAVMPAKTNVVYAMSGNGSANSPYQITSQADLEAFRNIVNGNGVTIQANACAVLKNDITVTGNWQTLIADAYDEAYYSGTFDGKNHTITFDINNGSSTFALFGYIGENGVVKNIIVSGAVTTTAGGFSAIARNNYGTVEHCTNNIAFAQSRMMVSGIVGNNYGVVNLCVNTQDLKASGILGGIVYSSDNNGIVKNCYNLGNLTTYNNGQTVGGIVGQASGNSIVEYCYNYGIVEANSSNKRHGALVGGMFGDSILRKSFYLQNETNNDAVGALSSGTQTNNIFLTTNEFKDQASFVGWDFVDTWTMGEDYPVLKAIPTYTVPTGLTAIYDQTLSEITLPEGFTWKTPTSKVGNIGENTHKVTFTPRDTTNYAVVSDIDVVITVEGRTLETTNNDGVEVKFNDTSISFESDMSINVETTKKMTKEVKAKYSDIAKQYLDKKEEIVAVYDIKLMQADNQISVSDVKEGANITITINIPEKLVGKNFRILHIHSEEDIQFAEYKLSKDGTKIDVTVDKLSEFAFVGAKGNTGSTLAIIMLILNIIVCACLVMFYLMTNTDKLNVLVEKLNITNKKLINLIAICVSCVFALISLIGVIANFNVLILIDLILSVACCGGFIALYILKYAKQTTVETEE